MQRKAFGILGLLGLILVAVLFGYWDMLNTEKLRIAENGLSGGDPTRQTGSSNAGSAAQKAPDVDVGRAAPGSSNAAAKAVPASSPESASQPSFDLLRVEPSGETVIAGSAPAGSRVTLLDGSGAIGEATANSDGQFAIALDKPLAPGSHSIALKATDGAGRSKTSRQTAIVSVPSNAGSGEVLAMIDSPDAPSRIVEMPKPAKTEIATAEPDDTKSSKSSTGKRPRSGDADSAAPDGEQATANTAERASESPVGNAPSASKRPDNSDPDTGTLTASNAAAASEPSATPSGPTENASRPKPASSSTSLRVEAVELQGDQVSVAGAVPSGAKVRIYIDNGFVAEDDAGRDDRFLASGKAQLKIGNHLVRADQLDGSGRVVARAEVPFDRPAGERVAAIAPPEPPMDRTAGPDQGGSAGGAAREPDGNRAADDASAMGSPGLSNGSGSDRSQPADGDSRQIAAASPPGGTPPEPARPSDRSPADPAKPDRRATGDSAVGAGQGADEVRPDASSVQPRIDMAFDGTSPNEGTSVGPVNRQAALTSVEGRVIIRKGDTLWRISRDTYGAGRRYTVIYLANGEQIRDPDRIYPGQVFRLPSSDGQDGDAGNG